LANVHDDAGGVAVISSSPFGAAVVQYNVSTVEAGGVVKSAVSSQAVRGAC